MGYDKMASANQGINLDIENMKSQENAEFFCTSWTFNHSVRLRSSMVPAEKAEKSQYSSGGSTAMLDAIGQALGDVQSRSTEVDKTLVKIFTDGEENASRIWSWSQIAKLIKNVEKEYNTTVTFVATEHDMKAIVRNLNLDESNTLVHDNTAQGITKAYQETMSATTNYISRSLAGEDVSTGFYTKE